MNWKGLLGMAFIGLGAVLTIISMATLSWIAFEDSNNLKYTIGLVNMQLCGDNACTSQSISKWCGGSDACNRYMDGGKQVIACGVVSLVVCLVGFICTFMAYRQGLNKWRMAATVSWFIAGALAILAVILYSKKTVMLDYSFILFLFSSFTSLIGCTVILVGPGVSQ